MPKQIPKYRPYLSVPALHRIVGLVCIDDGTGNAKIDKEIRESIGMVIARNNLGASKPAYIATPRVTLAEKLGEDPDSLDDEFEKLKRDLGVTFDSSTGKVE